MERGVFVLQLSRVLFGQSRLSAAGECLAKVSQKRGNLTVGFAVPPSGKLFGFTERSGWIGRHSGEFLGPLRCGFRRGFLVCPVLNLLGFRFQLGDGPVPADTWPERCTTAFPKLRQDLSVHV
jgi:hypothetical protein